MPLSGDNDGVKLAHPSTSIVKTAPISSSSSSAIPLSSSPPLSAETTVGKNENQIVP